ncbi:MAG: sigma-54-dependent Fis family transcriptional regulator [Anaerolineae bacterium]|jgi:DNA-binding NtrC family response regulator|nr:sigma-54-dependent Fis family transcriptional regulator [Anaerolineae bacterium]
MSGTILIVDDEENARSNISEFLILGGYEVIGVGTLKEARECLKESKGDIILLDVTLPDGYGPELLFDVQHMDNRPPVIIITAYGEIDMAVDAMKNGAHDFFEKPIDFLRLERSLKRAYELVLLRRELAHYRQSQSDRSKFVIGQSRGMKKLLDQAGKAAKSNVSVLITGESGTGKEVLAGYIYRSGNRGNKQFIPINCATIQPTMMESELFGHEAGAFTSADKRKPGLMEMADGGILFLDEISSMPLDVQAKLLRAIEEMSFFRVGGTSLIKVDVQIIAASNHDLKKMIEANEFRQDLYYRLKVVDLHLPPLRDRKDDIPELVGFFIRRFNQSMGMNVTGIAPMALEALFDYNWPGNIRELSNTIERAMIFCDGETIHIGDLPGDIARSTE